MTEMNLIYQLNFKRSRSIDQEIWKEPFKHVCKTHADHYQIVIGRRIEKKVLIELIELKKNKD